MGPGAQGQIGGDQAGAINIVATARSEIDGVRSQCRQRVCAVHRIGCVDHAGQQRRQRVARQTKCRVPLVPRGVGRVRRAQVRTRRREREVLATAGL